MWIAKFSLKYEGDIFTERTKKFKVNLHAYPLTNYKKADKYLFIILGILDGDNENKKEFIKDLKKDKRIKNLDIAGDVLTIVINYSNKEVSESEMHTFYDPSIVHVEAVLNSIDGREYWTAASFEKEKLSHLLDVAIKKHDGKMTSMVNSKISNFSLVSLAPKISEQQKKVISAAFKHGYYKYPRQIEIKDLAKTLGISYSTCQEHLRKAEIALLPSMLKKI